jgi:hypothetical protein
MPEFKKRMFTEVALVNLKYDGKIPADELLAAEMRDADYAAAEKADARIEFITPTGGY